MRIILDTDPGVDDAVALLWLLALDSRFRADIVGITTAGGVLQRRGVFDNVARILEYCRRNDLKIGRSAPHQGTELKHIHGDDGLAGISSILPKSGKSFAEAPNSAEQIVRWLEREPDDIIIITSGPLTNLAAAEKLKPKVLRKATQIVVTGGAFQRGDITNEAEYNAHFNAPAFHTVINSGANVAIIPLDITRQLDLNQEALVSAGFEDESQRIGKLLRRLCLAMIERVENNTAEKVFFVHSACAVAYALHPEFFETVEAHVDIEIRGDEKLHAKTTVRGGGAANNVTVPRRMDTKLVKRMLLADILEFSNKLR